MKKNIERIMGACLLALVLITTFYFNFGADYVQAAKTVGEESGDEKNGNGKIKEGEYTVIIDAGHGGFDPGKVGINDELEKDINLAIAKKLKDKLEKKNIKVIMTRTEDVALNDASASGKKSSDMRNRVKIINDAKASLCISIHQNSYTSKEVKGAQVFYYSKSEKGEKLAGIIQDSLRETLKDGNKRKEKANDNYYMLLKAECTSVIVECGFLSNWEEATNLKDEFYQEKIAEAISKAVEAYLINI